MKRKLYEVIWEPESKFRFWAVATLLFAGSLRVHEALARLQTKPCMQTTLLEEDVEIIQEKVAGISRKLIKLRLKSPKEDRIGNGSTVEIFGNQTFLCPIKALEKYFNFRSKSRSINSKKPVFTINDRKCYTGKDFNLQLSQLTQDVTDCTGYVVRSHSFANA